MKEKTGIIITGGVVGLFAVLLVRFGNPANMGFCIACFLRDIAGALGLHRAEVVQYIRPEIIGLVLGSFILASMNKEFNSQGGSSPVTRFVLSIIVMIGALIFLGCPLRMVLRIAGGDFNAIIGLIGFVSGIYVGIFFLNKGFNLKRSYKLTNLEGYLFPAINVGFLALLIVAPAFVFFSKSGPGAATAPIWISLAAGLIVGALAQKYRLCTVGGTRDLILFRDNYLMLGFLSILAVALVGNLILGKFNPGFAEQPIAHTDGLWNFLGMALVGWGSVLLGGCPLRQLILAGEGNTDSAISALGLIVGAAICHNFGLASSAKGVTLNGQISVGICFLILLAISYANSEFLSKNAQS
ncbi:MAG TPA: YedE family putative selenium transporter [Bacillota bacterium]|nr:YedE family putative selenium transporter [Clostridiaceae bacterium]HNR04410.1 YedE family putative selenium transporter [Bacillota bacterium]HNT03421.1 YedE family putative selenium transporter [Bacillota bacterium]HPA53612.1 YedE family putative selenium transporter [Bacillota bacterium]HPL98646.1 YedE family putative selenium transporter [Bacillota bacterium]